MSSTEYPGLWYAARHPPADPQASFAGKTVLVTGANIGLGFEAATKYAALGAASVILGVRTISKGEEAKASIIQRTGCSPDVIQVRQLDMSLFSSVQDFAAKLVREVGRLDVALLNAGVASPTYKTSPEGWEMSLQVNVLSSALLAILLLPKLRETSRRSPGNSQNTPHLEFTGSAAHRSVDAAKLRAGPQENLLETISSQAFFNATMQYNVAKLLDMYVIQALADAVRAPNGDPEVIVNITCPGFCRSNLGRDFPWLVQKTIHLVQYFLARTSEEGSRSLVSATAQGKESHGKFWIHDKLATPGDLVTSEEGQKIQVQAWGEILDVLRKQSPEVDAILEDRV
ncbi:MAG: hypothetical protein M4579_006166 [Chaenotheca gracillima]|nr:MAG: hypothetical protein M4579_006166 [Chaenotheca gracillima]